MRPLPELRQGSHDDVSNNACRAFTQVRQTPAMASCSINVGAPSRSTTRILRLSLKRPLIISSESGSPMARCVPMV